MSIADGQKSRTSTEVKARWNAATYKRYQIYLRREEDAELIQFIEKNKKNIGTTEIFRAGLEKLKEEGLK